MPWKGLRYTQCLDGGELAEEVIPIDVVHTLKCMNLNLNPSPEPEMGHIGVSAKLAGRLGQVRNLPINLVARDHSPSRAQTQRYTVSTLECLSKPEGDLVMSKRNI